MQGLIKIKKLNNIIKHYIKRNKNFVASVGYDPIKTNSLAIV